MSTYEKLRLEVTRAISWMEADRCGEAKNALIDILAECPPVLKKKKKAPTKKAKGSTPTD
jgi:hypothetical protein